MRLLEQAQAEEAASGTFSSAKAKSSMSGFYMSRNAFQGKHYVLLALEKSAGGNRATTVITVRPTTGRGEVEKLVSSVSVPS